MAWHDHLSTIHSHVKKHASGMLMHLAQHYPIPTAALAIVGVYTGATLLAGDKTSNTTAGAPATTGAATTL